MSRLRKLPLEPSGWVVVAVGLATLLGAWLTSWRELLVIAIGCLVVLAVAVFFVIGRGHLSLERVLDPPRVSVGERGAVRLSVVNNSSVPSRRYVIHDAFDSSPRPVNAPALAPGASAELAWSPPTGRRGVYRIGPARIAKSDPCRLMRRDVGHTGIDTFRVHPRYVRLAGMVGGLTRDLDGPTHDHSPAGDVAFHTVRPYRAGDDPRHVHWMATARAGEMMVRHYVDHRQPVITVVLDTAESAWPDEDRFERGVEVAASVAISAIANGHGCAVYTDRRAVAASGSTGGRERLLDGLAEVRQEPDPGRGRPGPDLTRILADEPETTRLVFVTGAQVPDALNQTATASAIAEVLVLRVTEPVEDPQEPERTVGTRRHGRVAVVEVADLRDLSARFRSMAGAR